MNSNYTIDAHGFTVQELHLAYCAYTFLDVSISFSFFFLFPAQMNSNCAVHAYGFTIQETKCTIHRTNNHFIQKNITNGSHGTIHTFKNYFVIVFLVFRF